VANDLHHPRAWICAASASGGSDGNAEPMIGPLLAIGFTVILPPLPSELSSLLKRAR
jgi:hypothetical protein